MVTVTREQTLNAGAEGPKRAGTRYPGGTKDNSLVNSSGSSSGKRKMNLQTSKGERAKGLSSNGNTVVSFFFSFFLFWRFIYLFEMATKGRGRETLQQMWGFIS